MKSTRRRTSEDEERSWKTFELFMTWMSSLLGESLYFSRPAGHSSGSEREEKKDPARVREPMGRPGSPPAAGFSTSSSLKGDSTASPRTDLSLSLSFLIFEGI